MMDVAESETFKTVISLNKTLMFLIKLIKRHAISTEDVLILMQ